MISIAILIDITQLLLDLMIAGIILDTIISLVAGMFFGLWFAAQGVSLMKKRPLSFMSTFGGELIPVINLLPTWTIFVWRTIHHERRKSAEL